MGWGIKQQIHQAEVRINKTSWEEIEVPIVYLLSRGILLLYAD